MISSKAPIVMNLRWDIGYWLHEEQMVFPDHRSVIDFADDQGIESPTISTVQIIVDTSTSGLERAWVVGDVKGPFEFGEYRARTDGAKIKAALRKLTPEEQKLLNIKPS